jgi:hypothetical protein
MILPTCVVINLYLLYNSTCSLKINSRALIEDTNIKFSRSTLKKIWRR